MVAVVAVLLGWAAISMFGNEPTPVATAPEAPRPSVTPPPAPVANNQPELVPEPKRAAPKQPDAPPAPVDEVIPDVPKSARDTIRGTIRVSIRVSFDKSGTVIAATPQQRGPSRYFERLATEASKQWTFTPANSAGQRSMLITFSFTRGGTTARADSPQ